MNALVQVVVDAALGLIAAFFGGLWFMLAVGVVHHNWIHNCPTISYWTAFIVVWLLQGIFESPSLTRAAAKVNNEL